MPDRAGPPTRWQKLWPRWGRRVIVTGLVAVVLLGVFVSIGAAGLLLLLVLALATFGSGTPKHNGIPLPPSVPGTYPTQVRPMGLFAVVMRARGRRRDDRE